MWDDARYRKRLQMKSGSKAHRECSTSYHLCYSDDPTEVFTGITRALRFIDYTRRGGMDIKRRPFGNSHFTSHNCFRLSLPDWIERHVTIPSARLAVMQKRKFQTMNTAEHLYLDLLKRVMTEGETRQDRTGVGTISLFGEQIRYDVRLGFPLWTTKKMAWASIVHELLWFLQGKSDDTYLKQTGTKIWDANIKANGGKAGPIYPVQWRAWQTHTPIGECINDQLPGTAHVTVGAIDQIAELIKGLKEQPHSRRHIVSAWNVAELDQMCLSPCHVMFQCYVSNDGWLDLQMMQRSADLFLGVPFNTASFALLLMMLAQVTGLKPRYFIHSFGDVHIYKNHIEQVNRQLLREPLPLPMVTLNANITDIDDFTFDDIWLNNYQSHATIKAEMAV